MARPSISHDRPPSNGMERRALRNMPDWVVILLVLLLALVVLGGGLLIVP